MLHRRAKDNNDDESRDSTAGTTSKMSYDLLLVPHQALNFLLSEVREILDTETACGQASEFREYSLRCDWRALHKP